jgi:two-component system nitrate/nitrite sensor histidine kinase NarX
LFDAETDGAEQFNLLEDLVEKLAPAIYTVYRLRRLRSRAGSLERARIARELHDTVIQTLIGFEMQVAVLRRRSLSGHSGMSGELARMQESLRQEILNIRDLIQRIKPHPEGSQLLDLLALGIERFRRETGICARFVTDLERAVLTPLLAREVVRILEHWSTFASTPERRTCSSV